MLMLLQGMGNVILPSRGSVRQISYLYLTLLLLLPLAGGIGTYFLAGAALVTFWDPGVVASSFGVLGGLLFAHAIFVFQLRVSYDAANEEPSGPDVAMEDLRVRPLIDEMFAGVLYASFVALTLTLLTGALAAVQVPATPVAPVMFAVVVAVGLHLVGCVWHVLSATTTAYRTLKKRNA